MKEEAPGLVSAPLQWLALRRFHQATFLDSNLRLSKVDRATFVGIEGPGEDGFDSIYITMMTLGWLTLAVPIRARLSLSNCKQLSLEEARAQIDAIVAESDMAANDREKLSRRIRAANSIAHMADAISNARE